MELEEQHSRLIVKEKGRLEMLVDRLIYDIGNLSLRYRNRFGKVLHRNAIFANDNKQLDLGGIRLVLSDLDDTVVVYKPYKQQEVCNLGCGLLREKLGIQIPPIDYLVERRTRRVHRAVVIDTQEGIFLRITRDKEVFRAYDYTGRELSAGERERLYSFKIDLGNSRFRATDSEDRVVDGLFYANLLEMFESHGSVAKPEGFDSFVENLSAEIKQKASEWGALNKNERIYLLALATIDYTHQNDVLKAKIREDLEHCIAYDTKSRYIKQLPNDSKTRETILHFRMARKTFALVTNSEPSYAKLILAYLFGTNWQGNVPLVYASAKKPMFFRERRAAGEKDESHDPAKGKYFYTGGNIEHLLELHHTLTGERIKREDVLVVGDHLFHDVISVYKVGERGMATCSIVPELDIPCEGRNYFRVLRNMGKMLNTEEGAPTLFRHHLNYSTVYTSRFTNLSGYPMDHRFAGARTLPPHYRNVFPGFVGRLFKYAIMAIEHIQKNI